MPDSTTSLPPLDAGYSLSPEQISSYQKDGHILLRKVAGDGEVPPYRAAISRAVESYSTEKRPLSERDTYGKAFLQITNLWTRDAAVHRFTLARRFAQIAAGLMGVPGVRLYHDQALFKEPGGGPTPWHQDQYYWPLGTDHTITMWMPLVDLEGDMGTLTFASGSHSDGYRKPVAISDESDDYFRKMVEERGFAVVSSTMKAGDATFHSGWTLHCAPGNPSSITREVMTVIYYADGALVLEPDNPNRRADMEAWLPGCRPGQPAASQLNPVLYRR